MFLSGPVTTVSKKPYSRPTNTDSSTEKTPSETTTRDDVDAKDVPDKSGNGDAKNGSNKEAPLPTDVAISYVQHIKPFLTTYCSNCHDAKVAKGGAVKGGPNFESFATIMKGGRKGRALLIPGQPEKSPIVQFVESNRMPPMKQQPQPKPTERSLLRSWVLAGATDDSGQAAPGSRD